MDSFSSYDPETNADPNQVGNVARQEMFDKLGSAIGSGESCCASSVNLVALLDGKQSKEFVSLVQCWNSRTGRAETTTSFKVHSHHAVGETEAQKCCVLQCTTELLQSLFTEPVDTLEISNCLNNSTTFSVHVVDSSGRDVCIAGLNFALCSAGTYINWLGVSNSNFNAKRFKNGDNNSFMGRGMGTCHLIAERLPPHWIENFGNRFI